MGYCVDYTIFDAKMKALRSFKGAACFGRELHTYISSERYFTYYIRRSKFNKKQTADFITLLKKIYYFKNIDFTDVIEKNEFTFDVTTTNSLHMFMVLTVLRHLEEDEDVVRFLLKNKDTRLSKLKLLILSSNYSNNTGHCISMYPTAKMVKEYKPIKIPPANNMTLSSGLQKVFFKGGTWDRNYDLFKIFKVKPV